MITSPREDLIVSSSIGILLVIFINLRDSSIKIIGDDFIFTTFESAIIVIFTILVLSVITTIRYFPNKNNNASQKNYFLQDNPWRSGETDILDYQKLAKKFTNKLLIEESSRSSQVFGIEAPWGAGKTSFLKMCEDEINKYPDEKPLVCWFDPWSFDSDTELTSKFFEELYKCINEKYYIPELNLSIKNYLNILSSVSIGQFSLNMAKPSNNLEKSKNTLIKILGYLNRNIIIIIDDLDRIPLNKAKQIFRLVSLNANFPSVKYILCYDLINLYSSDKVTSVGKLEGTLSFTDDNKIVHTGNASLKQTEQIDSTPIQKYLEKIINIKYVLPFYNKDQLLPYYAESIHKALFPSLYEGDEIDENNESVVTPNKEEIKRELSYLFEYKPSISRHFLSTLRQIKLVVNTLKASNEGDINFITYDTDRFIVIIYLILLKYHYPNIYSDICYYEFDRTPVSTKDIKYCFTPVDAGTYGFLESDKKRYSHLDYAEDKCLDDISKELLNVIFANPDNKINNYSLNQYIKIIEGILHENLSRKLFETFFKSLAEVDIKSTNILLKFEELLTKQYKLDLETVPGLIKKNKLMKEFFRMIPPNIHTLVNIHIDITEKLLVEIASSYSKYSSYPIHYWNMNSEYIDNIKEYLKYPVLSILVNVFEDTEEVSKGNFTNLKKISRYLLGDNKEDITSILDTICENEGIIYIDCMLSLHLSLNRNNNIRKALHWHKLTNNGQKEIPELVRDEAITLNQAMEHLSIKAFQIFNRKYIEKKRNIFAEIADLTIDDLVGNEILDCHDWIELIKNKEQYAYQIDVIKSDIESFTLFSLCNTGNEKDGIRCGGYKYGNRLIRDIMQDYLFKFCFKAEDKKGYKYFVEFLLKQFVRKMTDVERKFEFDIEHLYRFCDKMRLLQYWKENEKNIKEIYDINKKGLVITSNYLAKYRGNLWEGNTGIFYILDKELKEADLTVNEEINPFLPQN